MARPPSPGGWRSPHDNAPDMSRGRAPPPSAGLPSRPPLRYGGGGGSARGRSRSPDWDRDHWRPRRSSDHGREPGELRPGSSGGGSVTRSPRSRERDRDREWERERDIDRDRDRGFGRKNSDVYRPRDRNSPSYSASGGRDDDADRRGGRNQWDPPESLGYYEPPRISPAKAPQVSPDKARSGPSSRSDSPQVFARLDSFTRSLQSVLLRSGARDQASRALRRMTQFQADDKTLSEAQRSLDDAERALASDTELLQDAFVDLLRRALARPGVAEGETAVLEVDRLRERVAKLEKTVEEDEAKWKAEIESRPTSSLPPPPPPMEERPPSPPDRPPSSAPQSRAETSGVEKEATPATAAAAAAPEASAEDTRAVKRGRARALLNDVLSRLEATEQRMEDAMTRVDDLENEIAVRDYDLQQTTERWDHLLNRRDRTGRIRGVPVPPVKGTQETSAAGARRAVAAAMSAAMDVDSDTTESNETGAAGAQPVKEGGEEGKADASNANDAASAAAAAAGATIGELLRDMRELRTHVDRFEKELAELRDRPAAEPAVPVASGDKAAIQAAIAAEVARVREELNANVATVISSIPEIVQKQLDDHRAAMRKEVYDDILTTLKLRAAERLRGADSKPGGSGGASGAGDSNAGGGLNGSVSATEPPSRSTSAPTGVSSGTTNNAALRSPSIVTTGIMDPAILAAFNATQGSLSPLSPQIQTISPQLQSTMSPQQQTAQLVQRPAQHPQIQSPTLHPNALQQYAAAAQAQPQAQLQLQQFQPAPPKQFALWNEQAHAQARSRHADQVRAAQAQHAAQAAQAAQQQVQQAAQHQAHQAQCHAQQQAQQLAHEQHILWQQQQQAQQQQQQQQQQQGGQQGPQGQMWSRQL